MAISFVCSCGKHLRAGDNHAGRRIMCPACGSPVGVPASNDAGPRPTPVSTSVGAIELPGELTTAPGTSDNEPPPGPVLFKLRRHSADPNRSANAVWLPVDGALLPSPEQKVQKRRKRARRQIIWRLEKNWIECLFYPFRALPLVLGMGAALGICAGILVGILRDFAEVRLSATAPWAFVGVLLAVVNAGYAVGFLDCVLASAVAGEYQQIRWPGRDGNLVLRSSLTWLFSFLPGPLPFATAGGLYWFYGGDPDRIDQIILGELAVMTTGTWLLGLVSAAESGRLVAGPDAIAALFWRLGWGPAVALALAPASAFFLGKIAVYSLEEFHRSPIVGTFLLACTATSGMFAMTVLLRYMGVCAYRTLTEASRERRPPEISGR